jgi:uncharacterized membrane protein (GlpM family)
MPMQIVFRFIVGGLVVSLFAAFGDAVKPRSFAGLFSAAPSVAMATLGLAMMTEGKLFVATEARSMIFGAIALFLYAAAAVRLIMKYKLHAAAAAISALAVWMICAIGTWYLLLR